MPDDMILTSRGKPFTSQAYAEKALPEGYVAVEREGGWVGVRKVVPVAEKPLVERNQIIIAEVLSDAERADLEPDEPKEPVPDYAGQDILCPECGLSHHTTTNEYDPEGYANPAMIDLKPKYREWGWEELPKDSSMGYGCLVCPECGAALAPSGKLRVTSDQA